MKTKILIAITAILISSAVHAQFNLADKISDKVNQKVDQKVDEGIDQGINEAENSAKNSKKKKEKKGKKEESGSETSKESTSSGSSVSQNGSQSVQEDMKSYSKFDFVAGEKVVFFDDYSQDNVGDFPAKWNTNGKGEVVTNNKYSGKWLKMRNSTTYLPEIASKKFPENYTFEYDMVVNGEDRAGTFNLEFTSLANKNIVPDASDPTNNTGFVVTTEMNADGLIRYLTKSTINTDGNPTDAGSHTDINDNTLIGKANDMFHVSIMINKTRYRMYVNETKVLDLPKAIPAGDYNAIIFRMWGWLEDHQFDALLSNFRYAEGTMDVRSKLMTEGKLVTHGILFDVNSDKIKPESYGAIKEISQVLKDNPTVKVKIIGHTDSDGNAGANLDLSKRRAASVKNSLASNFGIDASRIETDGKGASEPAGPNTTPEGKANNRRVEFIKL